MVNSLSSKKNKLFYYPDQHWTCSGCGQCCKVWDVPITLDEKKSIEKLDIPGYNFKNDEYFIENKKNKKIFFIKKIDDKCIFQGDDELCIIHKLYGEPAKPLACRMFPIHLSLWNDGTNSVSFRQQCLAVSENQGKGITKQLNSIKKLISEVSVKAKRNSVIYSKNVNPSLNSLRIIADAYKKVFLSNFTLLKTNIYYAACLVDFHNDKNNTSDIMNPVEFEDATLIYLKENAETLEAAVLCAEPPDKSNLMAFAYFLTGYIRVDEAMRLKGFVRGRMTRAWSILKFIMNKGTMKDFGTDYPDTLGLDILNTMKSVTFSSECDSLMRRYMAVQLDALHFCGKQGIDLTFEEGLRHLILAYLATYAIAALQCQADGRNCATSKDISYSLRIIDHAFYHSPFFQMKHIKKLTTKLTSKKILPQFLSLI